MLDHHDIANDPAVRALVGLVRQRFGENVVAVLVYGSYLRGALDTLIDLYVLLDRFRPAVPRWQACAGTLLAPNVYHFKTATGAHAKCSVMRIDQLERAVNGAFVPYFWARFCQPYVVAYAANDEARQRAHNLLAIATYTLMSHVPRATTAAATYTRGFELTLGCELRAEPKGVAHDLYAFNAAYFDAAFAAFQPTPERPRAWRLRRLVGKLSAALRVIKSAATFDDPLDYVAWKTRCHSGVDITPTARQRRYPLIFGWSFLWRLYRRGGFR